VWSRETREDAEDSEEDGSLADEVFW